MTGPRAAGRRTREGGVAFLLVLTVLMALMVLATPFLVTSQHQNRASVGPEARSRARARMESVLRYARHHLERGHEAEEQLARAARGSGVGGLGPATPDYDTEDEMMVPLDLVDDRGRPVLDEEGRPVFWNRDPRGATVDLRIRDEHSVPNILTSPVFLIAATLGRTELAQDITDTATEIVAEDASAFAATGGFLNIEGEVIGYARREGNRFLGCQRGLRGGLRARAHPAEAYIFDDRAREIAMLPFASPRARGGYREPTLAAYLKEIALLGRTRLSPLELDRLDEAFALTGRRPQAGGFGEKVRILRTLDPAQADENGFQVPVVSAEGFNPGTVVRISDGTRVEHGIVIAVRGAGGFRGGGQGTLVLAEPPVAIYEQDRSYVQPLLRQPVNVNTAPREVLYRVIEGIQISFGRPRGSQGRVGREAAAIAVEAILKSRPIQDLQAFREVLEGLLPISLGLFSPMDLEAIFRNAVDANDSLLYHSSVPFCFASGDHYRLEGASVVADASGRELARLLLRERIRVAPTGLLSRILDTQADFEEPLLRARSGKYVASFPHPLERWISPSAVPATRIPRLLYRLGGLDPGAALGAAGEPTGESSVFEHGVFPARDRGFVRLATARVEDTGYTQHFDGPANQIPDPAVPIERIDDSGFRLDRGPFEMDPRDPVGGFGPRSGGGMNPRRAQRSDPGAGRFAGALMQRTTPNPSRFDLWFETGSSAGGRASLLDLVAGDDASENWIRFFRDSNGDLVGRIDDRTIDDPLDRFEEVAEVRWSPPTGGFWRPRTWYHLGFAYRGTKPSDLALFVDGFQRGRVKYQSRLTGGISATDTTFTVEDAEGWPERGVVMVGSEVIAVERSGNSFDVISFQGQPWGRGQRGSRALAHRAGTPVEVFGYSVAPVTANRGQGPAIPAGGGQLRDNLGPMVVATFEPNATVNIQLTGPGGLPIAVPLEVHDPAAPGGNILSLSATSRGLASYDAFPASGGYIVIVSVPLPIMGGPQGGIEFARYRSRAGNQLIGVEAVPSPPNPNLLQPVAVPGGGTLQITLTRQIHPVRFPGLGSQVPALSQMACVFPVSIAVNDLSGYRDPEPARGGGGGAANWHNLPEFVQVGRPDLAALEQHAIEWIRYHHMDRDGGHLLCDEGVFLLNAAWVLQNYHLGGASILNAHVALEQIVPFRRQAGTDVLGDGRVSAGSDVVPCFRTAAFAGRFAINNPTWSQQNPDAPVSGRPWSSAGYGDAVTVEGINGRDRRLAYVSWAGVDDQLSVAVTLPALGGQAPQTLNFPRAPAYDAQGWIAFTESPGMAWRQRGIPPSGEGSPRISFLRLLKFPSGELPDLGRGARSIVGGDLNGEVASADGIVDEVRVTSFDPVRWVVWDHAAADFAQAGAAAAPRAAAGVGAGDDEIPIARVEWLVADPRLVGQPHHYVLSDGRKIHFDESEPMGMDGDTTGLVRIGEEIIAFRSIGAGSNGALALRECTRGFMGTVAREHGLGADVVFLDFIQVARLAQAVDGSAARLPIAGNRTFNPQGGTLLIDSEMLHYTALLGSELTMPYALTATGDVAGGLFRGRYGTAPAAHAADAIVLGMPFRYWDRHVPRQDSGELSYYGLSLDLPEAFFRSVEVEKVRPGEFVDLEVLVRTDPGIPWSADPARTPGLFLFEDPTEKEPGFILQAGRGLDLRVRFKFLPGAFAPDLLSAHDWKRSADLERLRVHYLDQTRVLGREERR